MHSLVVMKKYGLDRHTASAYLTALKYIQDKKEHSQPPRIIEPARIIAPRKHSLMTRLSSS
ncbi:MAG: hypothetical protein QW772_05950 [Zestosphaera sp.]